MDKKKAFTLAEVLITLGIIGIVAAMTLSQLTKAYKKLVTVEQLKTTYSILSQAIEQSKETNGDIETWNTSLSNIDFAKLYILPYLKTNSTITQYKGGITPPYLYTLSIQSGRHNYYLFWTWNLKTDPIYVISNGTWLVYKYLNGEMYITVDINGEKGPNVMGIDGFTFDLDTKTNRLIPAGIGLKKEQILGITSNDGRTCKRDDQWAYYKGGYCAALIMIDGWKISEDYPWGNGGLTPIPKE